VTHSFGADTGYLPTVTKLNPNFVTAVSPLDDLEDEPVVTKSKIGFSDTKRGRKSGETQAAKKWLADHPEAADWSTRQLEKATGIGRMTWQRIKAGDK